MFIAILILLLPIGFYFGWLLREKLGHDKIAKAQAYCENLILESKEEAENLQKEKLLEAEEQIFEMRKKLEESEKQKLRRYKQLEVQLNEKEVNLDRKVDVLTQKDKEVTKLDQLCKIREKNLSAKEKELEKLMSEQNARLQMISGLTNEEAQKIQMENIMESVRQEAAAMIKDIKDKARLTANQKAKEIVIQAIQRSAISHVVETTVSVIKLPNDDMKGRIIGREGRNIRTFEAATGVEVLIDDTPEVVMLSGFDPIRREIAKIALEKLIYDGRIHPGRIEEVIAKSQEEFEDIFLENGEQAMLDAGVHGLNRDQLKLLGKLKYFTYQGSNVLQHCLEVATLAGLMAAELNLDVFAARKAGLLHELGMAVDNFSSGKNSEISADIAKKHHESEEVQNAIRFAHTMDTDKAISPLSVIVSSANEISNARLGAKKETLQNYFKRLSSLEDIADSFMGVTNSYAIQAGREIRIMVECSEINDAHAEQLATSISSKIQNTLTYPGQIKVTVIREYRSVNYAK
ncbi:MAG: ribonuclease Y [Deferribacteres bacterium]|nr:ribonuclease Y [candidate division KSB1 bacterium]MCB9501401.1 ribonuclease Y [Deferribacteres bacterium]